MHKHASVLVKHSDDLLMRGNAPDERVVSAPMRMQCGESPGERPSQTAFRESPIEIRIFETFLPPQFISSAHVES